MKETIIKVLAKVMQCEENEFMDDTIIKDIEGFDSLQFVMMISELQEKHNIEIPLDKALEVKTVGELIASAKQV